MQRAAEADGTIPGFPMVDVRSVRETVDVHRLRSGGAVLHSSKNHAISLWDVAECGLLRDLAGIGFAETARTVGCAVATASKRYGYHAETVRDDAAYLTIVGELTRQALEHCYGERVLSMSARLAEVVMSHRGAKSA